MERWSKKIKKRKLYQVPPRFELGSLDSKSRVLTITPWDLGWREVLKFTFINSTLVKFLKIPLTRCYCMRNHAPHFAPFFLFPSLKRIDIHKIKNISSNKHGLRLPKRLFPKNVKDKSDIMHNRQNQRQGSVRSCPRRHRVVSRRRWTGNELTIFIIIVLIRKFGGHLFAT